LAVVADRVVSDRQQARRLAAGRIPQSARFRMQGAAVPIDQPPESLPTEPNPDGPPDGEMEHSLVPAVRKGAERGDAQAPADPPAWTSLDTPYKLIGYVLSQDAYVKRLLKVYFSVMGSLILLAAILVVVAVFAPNAHLLIQVGSAILGVGASAGGFAYWRRWRVMKAIKKRQ
jgi:hypothetical protein